MRLPFQEEVLATPFLYRRKLIELKKIKIEAFEGSSFLCQKTSEHEMCLF